MREKRSDNDKYIINARWALGLNKKIFFVFLVGHDRRLEDIPQVSDKRQNANLGKALVYSGVLAWFLAGFFVLTFSFLYLVKSYAGIDLVKGGSPFPTFLKHIGICH